VAPQESNYGVIIMRINTRVLAIIIVFSLGLFGCEDTQKDGNDAALDAAVNDAAGLDGGDWDGENTPADAGDAQSPDTTVGPSDGGDTQRGDVDASDGGASGDDASDVDASDAHASDSSTSDSGASDADATDAHASDSGTNDSGTSDADTSDAHTNVTDPFDPQSCSGTAWTAADALARLSGGTSEILDAQTVMERHRTCDTSGCGPWGAPTVNSITYLTYSGGVTTRYKTLQTDTTLVLFDDAGTPKLSVRHDTHLAHYPNDHDEGLVFGFPPATIAYPMMRAWNVTPDHQYDYRDLENYLGRDAQLFASPNCARFESVLPGRSSDVYTEFVAVYRF
jgi:hypothetical protein